MADPTENWDDDFEFQPPRTSLLQDRKNTLRSCAEPGPSTPPKRAHPDAENWDDDFQDSTDSPLRPYTHDPASPSRRRRRETENWDDDFEDDRHASPSKTARWDSSSDEDGDLGFAEREDDKTVTSRSRRSALSPATDSPPPPVPPIPALFHTDAQPFPRSPTASMFSVPLSGRDSVAGHSYSSTAHLALQPTQSSGSSGALPPSPPTHPARERRRLRKKSRPARVDDIYELDDRLEPPARPVTPERSSSPPVHHDPNEPAPGATPASTGKSSLVSRIGSVGKKWGAARRKRASTGPAEVALQEGRQLAPPPSRPMSVAIPSSPPSSKGWFFRHGGDPGAGSGSPPSNMSALPLKHEKSVDRLLSLVGLDYDTPSKRKQKIRQGLPPDLTGHRDSIAIDASPRKPRVPSSSGSSSRPQGSRNASYGGHHTPSSRGSSLPRSASASVDDVTSRRMSRAPSSGRDEEMRTPRKSRSSLDPEGAGRGFAGGMRRISLTGKHKRSRTSIHGLERDEPSRPSTSTTSTAATAVPHLPFDDGTDVTPRPPSRVMPRLSSDAPLLPPIELQPPSPPRDPAMPVQSFSEPIAAGFDTIFESAPISSLPSSHSGTMTAMQRSAMLPSSRSTPTRMPASPPQSASLGRAAHLPNEKEVEGEAVPRRSSLGDLKIPARISQAQVGLRRDLGMVREFANSVEKLRDLQTSYYDLVADVQALIVETMPAEEAPSRALSPTLFGLPLPGYRVRSHTNPQSSKSASARQAAEHRGLAAAYNAVEVKYQLSWECAELLVELGGGTPAQPPSAVSSFHADHTASADGRKGRERAVTLAGDEAKPQISNIVTTPTSASVPAGSASQWRASTGRHDLSHRQLILLRDMLQHPDPAPGPAEANRAWRWGDAMSSTMTLPSEYSSSQHGSMSVSGDQLTSHKRRGGRLGMRALRDMLRSLKKSRSGGLSPAAAAPQPIPPSSLSVAFSTMSSLNLPKADPSATAQRHRARTSLGPESLKSLREHPNSPYVTPASLSHKVSPRRPSLASLFKLGQKSKSSAAKGRPSSGRGCELSIDDLHAGSSSSCQATLEDEDWDQLESASDLEAMSPALASGSVTVRRRKGQSLYIPPPPSSAHSSRYENSSQVSVASTDSPSTSSRTRSQVSPLPAEPGSTRSHTRPTTLSDVKELAELDGDAPRPMAHRALSKSKRQSYAGPGSTVKRPSSRNGKTTRVTGSLRNPPPGMWPGSPPPEQGPGSMFAALAEGALALAMTPENIRPLLENAREVHARCADCLDELRQLLAAYSRPASAAP